MSLASQSKHISFDDFLQQQLVENSLRSDFWDGEVVELEATTKAHNRIKRNIIRQLDEGQLQAAGCELYDENVLTELAEARRYVYPDIVVSCDPTDTDSLIVKSPALIVEILSDSTQHYDRTKKFFQYQRLPSLQQVIFVAQRMMAVESFQRQPNEP